MASLLIRLAHGGARAEAPLVASLLVRLAHDGVRRHGAEASP
jgi:hypothetical protein